MCICHTSYINIRLIKLFNVRLFLRKLVVLQCFIEMNGCFLTRMALNNCEWSSNSDPKQSRIDDGCQFTSSSLTTKANITEANEELPSHQPFCEKLRPKHQLTEEFYTIPLCYYDTLSQDDSVRNQYASLPYPTVTEQHLEREKKYYDSDDFKTPYIRSFALTLERLNHFLYNGRNTFQ